jgi:hypothetical protein
MDQRALPWNPQPLTPCRQAVHDVLMLAGSKCTYDSACSQQPKVEECIALCQSQGRRGVDSRSVKRSILPPLMPNRFARGRRMCSVTACRTLEGQRCLLARVANAEESEAANTLDPDTPYTMVLCPSPSPPGFDPSSFRETGTKLTKTKRPLRLPQKRHPSIPSYTSHPAVYSSETARAQTGSATTVSVSQPGKESCG